MHSKKHVTITARIGRKVMLLFFMSAIMLCFPSGTVDAATGKVKIKYNGKTYQNSSKKLPVTLNGKTISKKGYHAIKIKGYYMVSTKIRNLR